MFQLRNGIPYVEFYHKKRPDAFNDADFLLSNSYNLIFIDPSKSKWTTAEHYFQFCHYKDHPDKEIEKKIVSARFPSDLQKVIEKNPLSPELEALWDQRKAQVMLSILRSRFSQETNKKYLLATTDKTIIHTSDKDPFWGITTKDNQIGKNYLGQLMVRVRFEIANKLLDDKGKPLDPKLEQTDLSEIKYGPLEGAWEQVESKQLKEQAAWTKSFYIPYTSVGNGWPMPHGK